MHASLVFSVTDIYLLSFRKIRHKNIVQFLGACTLSPTLCIVTGTISVDANLSSNSQRHVSFESIIFCDRVYGSGEHL